MQHLINTWRNPARRRMALTIFSGTLIMLSLAAEYGLGLAAVAYPMMVAAALIAGSDVALRAWNSLRSGHISIELLVTIAATGALVIGEAWEAAAVTFLFLLGATLEARTMERTRKTLQGLLELAPMSALVLREGRQIEVSPKEVVHGETVIVKPGATIPVDGEVIDGRAAVDEHAVTGEPLAVEKEAEAPVYAGTIAQNGLLKVRAEGVGADTTLARIIQRVEEAQEERVPVQRFIDRFARWYTPAIIGLSVAVGLIFGDAHLALTLLVIGCPGALVIAAPVAVVAGIGRAAQYGI
ncbi:MAG: HAD-IC family P-type ATPase, partial [Rubrobacter sp.]|nr:HAD-IC family P-type ATPase [Rubrobacter sp.]